MKSILSTACLLAFSVGMVFSYKEMEGLFGCGNSGTAQLCLTDIEEYAATLTEHEQSINADIFDHNDTCIVVISSSVFNSYEDYINGILKIGSCETCALVDSPKSPTHIQ